MMDIQESKSVAKASRKNIQKEDFNDVSSLNEENPNKAMAKTGYTVKPVQGADKSKFSFSKEYALLTKQIKEMFNKEELLDEVDEIIIRHIDESEEEIYNSIQDLNDTLTQLIKDTVNNTVNEVVSAAKEELLNQIKQMEEETAANFSARDADRQKLETKLETKIYDIRGELIKADKNNFDKVLEIKAQLTDSMNKTMKEVKTIDSNTTEAIKNIKNKLKEEIDNMNEKIRKMAEFNEIIDKKVKRERSDVELQLKSTYSKIESNENKISELYTYDTRIENMKLSAIWDIHEEELSMDTNSYANQSDGYLLSKKTKRLSPRDNTHMLNDDLMKQLKLNNLPTIMSVSNKNNKSIDMSTFRETGNLSNNPFPVKYTYPPIEYHDLSLTKYQILKIKENLIRDSEKYLERNIFGEQTNLLIKVSINDKVDLDEDLSNIFSTQKQREIFDSVIRDKDNRTVQFSQQFAVSAQQTDRNSNMKAKMKLRSESSRKIHNKSVELTGINVKEVPYENMKVTDKSLIPKLDTISFKQKNSIFKNRSSISRSSIKMKNQNILKLNGMLPNLK